MSEVPDDAEKPPGLYRRILWGLFGVVGVVLLLVAFGVIDQGDGLDDSRQRARSDAERVCKETFIADRLKAPSTAEYDLSASGGPLVYTVTGTVDSENSFGAMLRSDVTCVVRDDGDHWTLRSLTGIG